MDNRQLNDVAHQLLSAPLGLHLLDLLSRENIHSLADTDLASLLLRTELEMIKYRSDYEEHLLFLQSRRHRFKDLAAWLPQRMSRWWGDIDRINQVWSGSSATSPNAGGLTVDLDPFSQEVPKPKHALWTSTRTSTELSAWAEWEVESGEHTPGPNHAWKFAVSGGARVAEIHSPKAWSALVRRYPSEHTAFEWTGEQNRSSRSARLDPDWTKVAVDWDGVHLSIGGLLTTEGAVYRDGRTVTQLRNWNVESTVWFRWVFDSSELVTPFSAP